MGLPSQEYASASAIGGYISICASTLKRWSESGPKFLKFLEFLKLENS